MVTYPRGDLSRYVFTIRLLGQDELLLSEDKLESTGFLCDDCIWLWKQNVHRHDFAGQSWLQSSSFPVLRTTRRETVVSAFPPFLRNYVALFFQKRFGDLLELWGLLLADPTCLAVFPSSVIFSPVYSSLKVLNWTSFPKKKKRKNSCRTEKFCCLCSFVSRSDSIPRSIDISSKGAKAKNIKINWNFMREKSWADIAERRQKSYRVWCVFRLCKMKFQTNILMRGGRFARGRWKQQCLANYSAFEMFWSWVDLFV